MQSNEFITEDNDAIVEQIAQLQEFYQLTDDHVDFARKVFKECKPYLKENPSPITLLPMYRGMRTPQSIISGKMVKLNDRLPKDTPEEFHHLLNDKFEEIYGEPFRNALFVTGDWNQAENYGRVFIIFPIGNYSFLWSPDLADLFGVIEDYASEVSPKEYVDNIFHQNKYHSNYLMKAITSGHEIMLRCESYHAIMVNSLDNKQLAGIQAILQL